MTFLAFRLNRECESFQKFQTEGENDQTQQKAKETDLSVVIIILKEREFHV